MFFDPEAGDAKAAIDVLQQQANNLINTLDQDIAIANTTIDGLNSRLLTTQQNLAMVQRQLDAVRAVKVYDHIECNHWNQNSKAQVGGSGLGAASHRLPGIECAELAILPDKPAVGGKNYFDCYYTQDFPLDDTLTKFKLEASWLFPTDADAKASQCLEMEARHIIPGGNMAVIACQLDFADNALRVFDHVKKWYTTGTPQARLAAGTWNTVILEGHKDATTVYYDGVTVNGVKSGVGLTADIYNLGWGRMNRVALQLDGNGAGTPYRVKIDNVRLTVS